MCGERPGLPRATCGLVGPSQVQVSLGLLGSPEGSNVAEPALHLDLAAVSLVGPACRVETGCLACPWLTRPQPSSGVQELRTVLPRATSRQVVGHL